MANTKLTILHSDRGSVFSVFSEEELKQMTESSERKIAVCGRINNSGIVEVPKGAKLSDIIELCGGILDKKEFKGAPPTISASVSPNVNLTYEVRELLGEAVKYDKKERSLVLEFKTIDDAIRALNILPFGINYNIFLLV